MARFKWATAFFTCLSWGSEQMRQPWAVMNLCGKTAGCRAGQEGLSLDSCTLWVPREPGLHFNSWLGPVSGRDRPVNSQGVLIFQVIGSPQISGELEGLLVGRVT